MKKERIKKLLPWFAAGWILKGCITIAIIHGTSQKPSDSFTTFAIPPTGNPVQDMKNQARYICERDGTLISPPKLPFIYPSTSFKKHIP